MPILLTLSSGLYKVVGSVSVIGSPVSLVSTLGTGVFDFFYHPAQGLVRSPADFADGLRRGKSAGGNRRNNFVAEEYGLWYL